MKNIWIIANWKSNKNIAEALEWISLVGPKLPRKDNLPAGRQGLKVVVCPTFSVIEEVKKAIQVGNFPLMVGSQDLSPFDEGAYTGEEAAAILNDLVELSILGHSERRQNFGESDEMVERKTAQAIAANIIPLVCVQGQDIPIPSECNLVAYEPIFAIGTGNPDTPENAESVAKKIKEKVGQEIEILYGGSVNSENCKKFLEQEDISGFLIGKASLDGEEFVKIIDCANSLI
ncbi:MAG: Triosephosphate isomerase [uncultured bacterium]|uniref:Triosephosphate isomerase n=3 Tax=Candidatus Daviesiibacteriota TaxID=1752718 RepID=A0A0G0F3B7_9BACT|nr:MAG: Triosephosphate isomerase [uncultured bacterium]KKQ08075.1 MAG: Triosephosphate isomerase [Candidatus Daviesbacteria bacterium GW2011_GWB1_36_5]KKQ16245.1 MAG: Triosephosphate isomerase [Candidatus Daviesbacteria bacterium GW2011_GWA1_36_8]OGE33113.1 MAG: hypothetical protein A3C99_03750 [Candidatus Daviesbacteria bacterium RIFCSPHIGHO2_02_FULL_37_9]OGE36711.1 MAG: hypothetical protein A3E66_02150 [Candidatus Daviesbacteria bacterium RIFCSPHIGHO2_12_FULL_37_16]